MWICRFCETENQDDVSSCVCCGHEKQENDTGREQVEVIQTQNQNTSQNSSKKKHKLLLIPIAIITIIVGFFTIHVWKPATCTEPEVCSICGKVRSPATGHKWTNATCTEPQRCSVCGETGNSALGHNWKESTYETPKTCSRCGLQEGLVKGYYGSADGYYSDEWASMPTFTNWLIHPYILYQEIDNCRNFDFTLSFSYTSGTPFGDWEFFVRNEKGRWISVGVYDVQDTETTVYVYFDQPTTITAVGADRLYYNPCDMYFGYTIANVQRYVD